MDTKQTVASVRSHQDAPVEMTDDSYAQLVNDAQNKPFIALLLKLREGLSHGELSLHFKDGRCVRQVKSVSSQVSC